jgi:DNA-binding NtrC family response regulator
MDTEKRSKPLISGHGSPAPAKLAADRNLLCYRQPGSAKNNLARELVNSGWKLFPASSPQATASLVSDHSIPVGIIFVDGDLPEDQVEDIHQILASAREVAWFAQLNDRRRMSDAVCDLVAFYCSDFFTPPYDSNRINEVLGHAAGMSRIRQRSHALHEQGEDFHGMVGSSPPMRKLYRQLEKVAHSDAPALLTGESGTGKELAARAIHRLSRRADGPFIVINCAAVPESLIQDELFGHEKGAFTGADHRHIGHLESARGGVIFLDEISDMPMAQQVNLLRFLEDRCIERLGGEGSVNIDMRVVVATHDGLEERVEHGSFREDLFYRLNVLQLEIPSLRDRKLDILPLAEFALEEFSREAGNRRIRGFDKRAARAMLAHPWPGNVRELINRVRRALVMSENRLLSAPDMGLEEENQSAQELTLGAYREEADRKAIATALQCSMNNLSHAATTLGISRTTLYRMMDKLDIHP